MSDPKLDNLKMDPASLYREELYTDLRAGQIRKLVPVTADGADDPSRPPVFSVSAQVMTPAGVLPLSGRVENASTLSDAVAAFGATIQTALDDLRSEMEAIQRERASQIVLPGRDNPPPPDLLIH